MSNVIFPKDFIWGATTASYQIEGAADEDGRGETIWDRFSHTPGKVHNGDTGDRACDHYHRFHEDVKIMKELGLKGYRFSVAWSRIYPEGKGNVNQKGIDFYNVLVDELLKEGIEPMVTLYHWDLPQKLQEQGGWASREIINYFADFAATVFEKLGDRVKKWITLNEPWVFSSSGYYYGDHAPGYQDFGLALRVSHHALLAHGRAMEVYRQGKADGQIGITLSFSPTEPDSQLPDDQDAAWRADGFLNRWYLDPVFKGKYPEDMLVFYSSNKLDLSMIKQGDLESVSKYPVDFLGANYYFRTVVRESDRDPVLRYQAIKPAGAEYTEMGWGGLSTGIV